MNGLQGQGRSRCVGKADCFEHVKPEMIIKHLSRYVIKGRYIHWVNIELWVLR